MVGLFFSITYYVSCIPLPAVFRGLKRIKGIDPSAGRTHHAVVFGPSSNVSLVVPCT